MKIDSCVQILNKKVKLSDGSIKTVESVEAIPNISKQQMQYTFVKFTDGSELDINLITKILN